MEFINKNNMKIYYEIINENSSKGVLVFLNGVMASTNSWANQYEVLKQKGYKIILHDFLGQLRSDKFKGLYTFEKHANDVYNLLNYLGIKKAHLIGTSYGGEVALKYGILYPSNVKSISVIDSVTELDDNLINSVNNWIKLAETFNGELFFNGMMPSIYGKTYIKNNKEMLNRRSIAMNSIPNEYFEGQIGLYNTFIDDVFMTDELNKITSPCLIICGEEDTLKPVKFSKIINENIKTSKLVIIPDCGHVTIFEKPMELNKELVKFIGENE